MTSDLLAWGLIGAYVMVGLIFGRWAIRDYLIFHEREKARRAWANQPGALDDSDRLSALGIGVCCFFFWPYMLPYILIQELTGMMIRGKLFTTPAERAAREREKVAAARKLAEDHGLEFPEVDRRG